MFGNLSNKRNAFCLSRARAHHFTSALLCSPPVQCVSFARLLYPKGDCQGSAFPLFFWWQIDVEVKFPEYKSDQDNVFCHTRYARNNTTEAVSTLLEWLVVTFGSQLLLFPEILLLAFVQMLIASSCWGAVLLFLLFHTGKQDTQANITIFWHYEANKFRNICCFFYSRLLISNKAPYFGSACPRRARWKEGKRKVCTCVGTSTPLGKAEGVHSGT